MESLASRLNRALKEKNNLFVFDIDSTIFNVSPRNQAILNLFSKSYANQLTELPTDLAKIKLSPTDWGIRPYNEKITNQEIKQKARKFWNTHFFAGTFLPDDQPYEHIINVIQELKSKGAKIKYLTGRDHHRMRQGSLLQLKHWQLPLDQDEDLITKPHKDHLDQSYKRTELKHLLQNTPYSNTFFFDNEPSVFEHCLFPEKTNYTPVFIKSTHSAKRQPCPSWWTLSAFEYLDFLNLIKASF